MWGPILKQVVRYVAKEFGASFAKSVQKAYQEVLRNNARRKASPFEEFKEKVGEKMKPEEASI